MLKEPKRTPKEPQKNPKEKPKTETQTNQCPMMNATNHKNDLQPPLPRPKFHLPGP